MTSHQKAFSSYLKWNASRMKATLYLQYFRIDSACNKPHYRLSVRWSDLICSKTADTFLHRLYCEALQNLLQRFIIILPSNVFLITCSCSCSSVLHYLFLFVCVALLVPVRLCCITCSCSSVLHYKIWDPVSLSLSLSLCLSIFCQRATQIITLTSHSGSQEIPRLLRHSKFQTSTAPS